MNIEMGRKLLDETFNKDFDVNRYARFVRELFNNFNMDQRNFTIWSEYQDYIESFFSLGSYIDESKHNIDVIVVKLRRTSSRDRARTMQRNFIAKYLGSIGKDAALAAFYGDDEDWRFSFVKMDYDLIRDEYGNVKVVKELTPAKRFSFLVGRNEPNHTCKSQLLDLIVEEEINPSLEEIESAFSVDNVTKIFFSEYKNLFLKLNDELINIVEGNEQIRNDFEEKGISTIDFSKKLLGQIVFIYFLQKKGWLGVVRDTDGKFKQWGSGSKDFLRKLYNKEIVEYDNFFNDILEPLFYEALATPREEDDYYYSKFKCKIPFLNGGLFEPINDYDWVGTEINLSNNIFGEILDTFDRYNFTVKEDEPLEKEVAVDPEMLGKVFENLLEIKDRKSKGAFYTPREIVHYMCQQSLINYLETNTSISRENIEEFIRLGDFTLAESIKEYEQKKSHVELHDIEERYTIPKSIKDDYLLIDKLLKEIKIVDPAVGSGAFLVGMMNEIVKARSLLGIYFKDERKNYDLKREIIENCLYGVDIEPSAVEITQLRLWLSLIVDELDMKNIKPLPNLGHKIMCGNSLLEEFEGIKLFDERLLGEIKKEYSFEIKQIDNKISMLYKEKGEIASGKKTSRTIKDIDIEIKKLKKKKEEILTGPKEDNHQVTLEDSLQMRIKESQRKLIELKKLQKEYFSEQNRKIKRQLRENIDKIEWELIEKTLKEQSNEEAMQKLKQYKKNKAKPFFLWKLYFAEVFQRENPGFDVVIANPPYVGESGHKEMFRELRQGMLKEFYRGKMDLFYFFFHLALNLGRQNAQISFITTNYYLTATNAKKLREDFKERAIIRNLINFSELKIFESALGQHNMITILTKNHNDNYLSETCTTKREGIATPILLNQILSWEDDETEYFSTMQRNLYEGDEYYIRLSNSNVESKENPILMILEKIRKGDNRLGIICNINQGVVSGCDYVSERNIEKLNSKNDIERNDGIFVLNLENPRDKSLLKTLSKEESKLLRPFFKNSDIRKYWCKTKPSKLIFYLSKDIESIDDYLNIKKHLSRFRSVLEERREVKQNRLSFFHLQWARSESIFIIPKIVAPYRSEDNNFAYNEIEWFCRSDSYIITQKDSYYSLKYILSLLNSHLYCLWLYFKGKRKGKFLELFQVPLSEIPIKNISPSDQESFIYLVDQILALTIDDNYLYNSDKQARVKKLQKEIDQLVYKLYELTPEEIEIVENFIKEK